MATHYQQGQHGPLSGPALSIISCNVTGLSDPKQDLLAELCRKNECHILCLQETRRGPTSKRPQIAGMTLTAERQNNTYGSAIFVRDGLTVDKSLPTDDTDIEALTIEFKGITVTSVYKRPRAKFALPCRATINDGRINVIIGDFNSHNVIWGYSQTDADGRRVEKWSDDNQLSLIHDENLPGSFYSPQLKCHYNLDLMFVSTSIAGQCEKAVLDPIKGTKHRPIVLKIRDLLSPPTNDDTSENSMHNTRQNKEQTETDISINAEPGTSVSMATAMAHNDEAGAEVTNAELRELIVDLNASLNDKFEARFSDVTEKITILTKKMENLKIEVDSVKKNQSGD
ncbi:PREDICTED: uncharacterized protein LOC106812338 [Priapulus caudatus]|uniref:Uncharacterized protein LOC106812338 n=1 Tax=Priapulus caudatus TaxID=37621 RepID=A0ABM1EHK1_PRICU|nr:PREDICTED: uncharacterized protein LOC106812338 [Priapulus caudatus]